MTPVVALYVEKRGPYPALAFDYFDAERDARTYNGPHPVVAHPPCERWGKLAHFSRNDTRELAIVAVDQVRRFGGVLEHPAGSKLWQECGLPPPDQMFPDSFGGLTYEIAQGDYGHKAPKLTWLYAVRLAPCPFTLPTGRDPGGRVELIGKFARKATPHGLAARLVTWAATATDAPGSGSTVFHTNPVAKDLGIRHASTVNGGQSVGEACATASPLCIPRHHGPAGVVHGSNGVQQ